MAPTRSASTPKATSAGHWALPRTVPAPAILVIHAWWGLTPFLRGVCDRLADEGFVAYAPDLYHGATATSIEDAKRLRAKLDHLSAEGAVTAAADLLPAHAGVRKGPIGAIGFSLGAAFTLALARARPQAIRAVVLFYGVGGGKFNTVKASIQGHFAEDDQWGADPAKADALQARILASGLTPEFYTYPGTGHWFFEKDRSAAYNTQAAELAWKRTLTFLRKHLS